MGHRRRDGASTVRGTRDRTGHRGYRLRPDRCPRDTRRQTVDEVGRHIIDLRDHASERRDRQSDGRKTRIAADQPIRSSGFDAAANRIGDA